MTPYIQVMTTLPDRAGAERLTALILAERLAACVQISACASWYHWQGAIEQADEQRCLLKTRRALFPELSAFIRAHHPYQVPEIVVTPIEDGSADYLDWLDQELRPAEEPSP